MNILHEITQIINKPGFWLVPSASGGDPHEVNGHTGSCDCKDYVIRRAGSYDLCRHGRALRHYLDAQKACPACGGKGNFPTQLKLESGSDPIPCVTCECTGKREGADPYLLAVADRCRAEQDNARLLELFR